MNRLYLLPLVMMLSFRYLFPRHQFFFISLSDTVIAIVLEYLPQPPSPKEPSKSLPLEGSEAEAPPVAPQPRPRLWREWEGRRRMAKRVP